MKRARDTPAVTRSDLLAAVTNKLRTQRSSLSNVITAEKFRAMVQHNAHALGFDAPADVFRLAGVERVRLDDVHIKSWVRDMKNKGAEYAAFARALITGLEFVTWDDFTEAMLAAADEVADRLENEPGTLPSITVLMVHFWHLDKSNMWLSGFVFDRIRADVDFVVSDWRGLVECYEALKAFDRGAFDVNVIYVDDMVYSGKQLVQNVFAAVLFEWEGNGEKPRVLEEAGVADPAAHATYHMVVPYITQNALDRISPQGKNIFFPTDRVLFPPLGPHVAAAAKALAERVKKDEGYKGFARAMHIADVAQAGKPLVLFEHKIADSVSLDEEYIYGNVELFGLPPLTNYASTGAQLAFYKRLDWCSTDGEKLYSVTEFQALFRALNAQTPLVCAACYTQGEHPVCGRCASTPYCSVACQARHWEAHAKECCRNA